MGAGRIVRCRFAVRVAPIYGEGARGYLMRVAQANGYPAATWFRSGHAVVRGNPVTTPTLAHIQDLLVSNGFHKDDADRLGVLLAADSVRHGHTMLRFVSGLSLPPQLFDRKRPKVCPLCIGERALLYAAWDCCLWTACPIHGCEMVCQCPGCGKNISWYRSAIDRCCPSGCFADVPAMPAKGETVDLMRALAQTTGFSAPAASSSLTSLVGQLGFCELCELVRHLGAAPSRKRHERHPATAGTPRLTVALEVVDAAARALCRWPQGFHELLDASRAPTTREKSVSLREEFGALAKAFSGPLRGPAFDFARTTFFDHLTTAYPGWTKKVTGRASLVRLEDIGLGEASELLGLSQSAVACHLRAGRLPGVRLRAGPKPTWLLKSQDVLDARQRERLALSREDAVKAAGAITQEDSESRLGVSPFIVRQLYKAGLLGVKDVPVHFHRYLATEAVQRIVDRMEALAAGAGAPSHDEHGTGGLEAPRPLTSLIRVGFGPPFAEVLRIVLEQRIAPNIVLRNAVGLGRFAFSPGKLSRIATTACNSAEYVNQGEIMRLFRWDYAIVTRLTAAGLIERVALPVGTFSPPNAIYYRREQLVDFTSKNVTASALAGEAGLEPWCLLRRLRARGAAPILDDRSPKRCFWNRIEASHVVAEGDRIR